MVTGPAGATKFARYTLSPTQPVTKFAQHGPSTGISAKKFAQQPQKRQIWGVSSAQGELFHAHTHDQAVLGELFHAQDAATCDVETDDTTAINDTGQHETTVTTATEKHAKNARFSPAKAMTVSIPRKHTRVKATVVSDNRATWSTGPRRDTHGWR